MSCNDREKRALNLSAQMDISRSTIDRENWKIKNRKISEERNIRNKGYDQARGRTCVGFCLNMLVSSSLVSAIAVMPGLCTCICVGRRYQNRGEVLLGLWVCLFWCFQNSSLFGNFA